MSNIPTNSSPGTPPEPTRATPLSERERADLMAWASSPEDVKRKRTMSAATYARTIRRYEATLRSTEQELQEARDLYEANHG